MNLPPEYSYLMSEPGPRILREALDQFGTTEVPGRGSNPTIIGWANEIGGWQHDLFTGDHVPWCGLFMAFCAKRSGQKIPINWQRAFAWVTFGMESDSPKLGDILVFTREGGGHVALYVGEDSGTYHVLGGNQADQVCIRRFPKTKLYAARRCKWLFRQPPNVRKIFLNNVGQLSTKEA